MYIFLKKELSSPENREAMAGQLLEYGFNETIEAEVGRTAQELKERLAALPESARVAVWFPGAGVHSQETVNKLTEAVSAPQDVAFITFEESIPNVLGELVEKGEIKSSDARIVFLKEDGTKVEPHYDDEGILRGDWPLGWFTRF